MSSPKVAITICILALVIGGIFYVIYPTKQQYDNPQACTQEAKQCPDGSYVGRTGPNCTFANCPNGLPPGIIMEDGTIPESTTTASSSTEPVFCAADVKACPDGSYVGRVSPTCNFAQCPTH